MKRKLFEVIIVFLILCFLISVPVFALTKKQKACRAYGKAISSGTINIPDKIQYAISDLNNDGYPELLLFNYVSNYYKWPKFLLYSYKDNNIKFIYENRDETLTWFYNKSTNKLCWLGEGDCGYIQYFKMKKYTLITGIAYQGYSQNGKSYYFKIKDGVKYKITNKTYKKKWNDVPKNNNFKKISKSKLIKLLKK